MRTTTVVETYQVVVWPEDAKPESAWWNEVEVWAEEPLECSGSSVFLGGCEVSPGDFLVKATCEGAIVMVMRADEISSRFSTAPTPLQPLDVQELRSVLA